MAGNLYRILLLFITILQILNKELGGDAVDAKAHGTGVADAKNDSYVKAPEGKRTSPAGKPRAAEASLKANIDAANDAPSSSTPSVSSVSDSVSSLNDHDLKVLRSKKKPIITPEEAKLPSPVKTSDGLKPYRKSIRSPTQPRDFKEVAYLKEASG